jgi:hypothetical protein
MDGSDILSALSPTWRSTYLVKLKAQLQKSRSASMIIRIRSAFMVVSLPDGSLNMDQGRKFQAMFYGTENPSCRGAASASILPSHDRANGSLLFAHLLA